MMMVAVMMMMTMMDDGGSRRPNFKWVHTHDRLLIITVDPDI